MDDSIENRKDRIRIKPYVEGGLGSLALSLSLSLENRENWSGRITEKIVKIGGEENVNELQGRRTPLIDW